MPLLDCETGHEFKVLDNELVAANPIGSFSLVPNFDLCHRSPLLFWPSGKEGIFREEIVSFSAPFPNLWRGWGRWRRRQFPNCVLVSRENWYCFCHVVDGCFLLGGLPLGCCVCNFMPCSKGKQLKSRNLKQTRFIFQRTQSNRVVIPTGVFNLCHDRREGIWDTPKIASNQTGKGDKDLRKLLRKLQFHFPGIFRCKFFDAEQHCVGLRSYPNLSQLLGEVWWFTGRWWEILRNPCHMGVSG